MKFQMVNKKYLRFDDRWLMVIVVPTFALLIPFLFFGLTIDLPLPVILTKIGISFIYCLTYWIGNRLILIKIRERMPAFDQALKRLMILLPISLIYTITVSLLGNYFLEACFTVPPEMLRIEILRGTSVSIVLVLLILAIYEVVWFYSELKKSIQQEEQAKVAHVQSQLDGLRNQVNPHFLFNSLNTLNFIVDNENKEQAKDFIRELSAVYRYILESRNTASITLDQELEFVNAYVAIQKERFLEGLEVSIEVPDIALPLHVIPLSIQLLIENAIKHNIISRKQPLKIDIGVNFQNDTIWVRNNLQRRSKILHSTKTGLENIRKRYKLLAPEQDILVQESVDTFEVQLPILQMNVKKYESSHH